MTLSLLFTDELRGFYKSKVMLFLWVGLPAISILFSFIQSAMTTTGGISFAVLSSIVVSSLAGTLSSVMLAVSIINEKNRRVYDLFLIRPLSRRNIILAKFFSVYTCVAIASFIAILAGILVDLTMKGTLSAISFDSLGQSLAISLSMVAISCAAGVLIGVGSPTVLVGAILVIYGGNQISVVPLIPTILNINYAVPLTIGAAILMAGLLLALAIYSFEKKQF